MDILDPFHLHALLLVHVEAPTWSGEAPSALHHALARPHRADAISGPSPQPSRNTPSPSHALVHHHLGLNPIAAAPQLAHR